MFHQALQDFDRGKSKTLYGQEADGFESTDLEKTKTMKSGSRLDRQGGQNKDQEFNVQAQTNGRHPTTFAACVGWKECGADRTDVLKGLQESARQQETVHLVSPNWTPQEEAP
jgi:hypothetical protein